MIHEMQKSWKWQIVSTHMGFIVHKIEEKDVDNSLSGVVATHNSLSEAEAGIERAKELEKVLRPHWQMAIEHERRVRDDMLARVWAAAKPLAPDA